MSSSHARGAPWASPSPATAAALAFAGFGAFWGAWGAGLPVLRAQAGLTDAQLGSALLLVGAGALPAMALTPRLLDRAGPRTTGALLAALGVAGLAIAALAHDATAASAGMLLVGATSGAADVAINTLAGDAEHRTGRPVLTRSHGAFSAAVVLASLATGALLGRGSSLTTAFAGVAAAVAALATATAVLAPARAPRPRGAPRDARRSGSLPGAARIALVGLGLVGALAYAAENAHQSWGAVLLTDAFGAPADVAALAPATFATAAAVARFALAPLSRSHPLVLLVTGGVVAAGGTLLVAVAPSVPVALGGLAVAAAGTATLFPTLLSHGLRDVAPEARARATSTVATTAYLGFLLGPPFVGALAGATSLRTALLGVAALALAFAVTAAPVSRRARAAACAEHHTVRTV